MANRQYGCWGYKPKPLVNEGDDLSPLEHDDDRAKQIESALLELVEAKYYYNSRCTPYSGLLDGFDVPCGVTQHVGVFDRHFRATRH